MLSERAFPLCPTVTVGPNNFSSSSSSSSCSGPSIVVVTSYGIVRINEYRSLWCCELGETVQVPSSNGIRHLARATQIGHCDLHVSSSRLWCYSEQMLRATASQSLGLGVVTNAQEMEKQISGEFRQKFAGTQ